jgi:hypothetical protein
LQKPAQSHWNEAPALKTITTVAPNRKGQVFQPKNSVIEHKQTQHTPTMETFDAKPTKGMGETGSDHFDRDMQAGYENESEQAGCQCFKYCLKNYICCFTFCSILWIYIIIAGAKSLNGDVRL